MRSLIFFLTGVVIVLWSAFSWLVHGLIGVGGNLVASNADLIPADPLLVEWASWLAFVGTGLGEWLVVAIWAVVSLIFLAIGLVAARFVPRSRPAIRSR